MPLTAIMRGVWGFAIDDVWFVGDGGAILHWNGSALEAQSSGTSTRLLSISGTSRSDLWAVGDSGRVLRSLDGGRVWSELRTGLDLRATHVVALGGGQALVSLLDAGGGSELRRWTGTSWAVQAIGPIGPVVALSRADADTVWLACRGGTLWRWRPGEWTMLPATALAGTRISFERGAGAWASGGSSMQRVGSRWVRWGVFPHSIRSADPRSLWMLSNLSGQVSQWHSGRWTRHMMESSLQTRDLFVASDRDVWLVVEGSGGSRHWDGVSWMTWTSASGRELYGTASNDVWILGNDVMRWDGITWGATTFPGLRSFDAMGGVTRDRLFIASPAFTAGRALLFQWNGSRWSVATDQIPLYEIFGLAASARDVCVGGTAFNRGSTVVCWDGVTVTAPAGTFPGDVADMTQDSAGRMWALTRDGAILTRDP